MFWKKDTKSEAAVPGADGWVEDWDRPENKGVPFFVAYYKATNQLRAGRIAVPASRVCPDADKTTTDGKGTTVRVCDFPGWDYRRSKTAPPANDCPGKRWDGQPCEQALVFRGITEVIRPKNYTIKANSEWLKRLCEEKGFPKLDDPADSFYRVTLRGDPEHPFRGRTWRQALNLEILPKMRQPGRRKPGERGHRTWKTQGNQDALQSSTVERVRRRPST